MGCKVYIIKVESIPQLSDSPKIMHAHNQTSILEFDINALLI